MRTTLATQTRTIRADDEGTLVTEALLTSALYCMGEYAEAEALGRHSLEKVRRIFDRDHHETLTVPGNLAIALSKQGKNAEPAEIGREVSSPRPACSAQSTSRR